MMNQILEDDELFIQYQLEHYFQKYNNNINSKINIDYNE